jgi:hypothetical protein
MTKRTTIGGLTAGAILCTAAGVLLAATPTPKALPDFSGVWVRSPDYYFFPVPGETNVPLVKLPVTGPKPDELVKTPITAADEEEIMAGDYHNPILLPKTREVVKKNAESEIALHHIVTASNACWPSGVPQIYNLREPTQILQTKDKIVIIHQRDHQVQWIWLNQPHSKNVTPSWYGESVGHWEGDTLVVDTIGIKAHELSVADPWGTPHSDKLHVVERWRLGNDKDGKFIEIILSISDPEMFKPWKAQVVFRPNRAQEILEVVCAENNRDFSEGETFGKMPVEDKPSF